MKSKSRQTLPRPIEKKGASIIISNDEHGFIGHDQNRGSGVFDTQKYLTVPFLPVIDQESLQLIEVLRLHKAIDRTDSATGSAVLMRSLIQPSTDLKQIHSIQDALREIAADDALRQTLEVFIHEFSNGESALYKFFNKKLYALFPYLDLKNARQSAACVTNSLPVLPKAESSLLKGLISSLKAYKGSPLDQMMTGSVYKTFNGLNPKQAVAFWTPRFQFIPRRFTKWLFAGPAVAGYPYVHQMMEFEPAVSPLMSTAGLGWTAAYGFYCMAIKPVRDTGNFIEPLREKCVADAHLGRAIDAIGIIDTLLSHHRYACDTQHPMVLPKISDETHHFFEAEGLKNPITAQAKIDFIPNSIHLNGAKLTFLSGPNSGGKTTLCKSIVHNQLLAQMGAYVMADKAAVSIADIIRYQAPKFDGLQDSEGRFGTELARTRDIFYATTPKSLLIFDELAEGTTYEEQLDQAFGILSDFYSIGNNTVLVTHNHSLVERFKNARKGQALQVEFLDEEPTYRVKSGISTVSHAAKVARRINFSSEDRHQHMVAKGYR